MEENRGVSAGLVARMALMQAGFEFTHSLGQNFILEDSVVDHILSAADVRSGENVLEIGPGAGVMTAKMADAGAHVLAVELDEALAPVLKKVVGDRAEIVYDDAMRMDLDAETMRVFSLRKYRVVANLPYYITSDVILRLLSLRHPPESITVMVQKEAADRIMAHPGEKAYCALAATVQYYGRPEVLLHVPSDVFMPKPHVDSCLLRIALYSERPVMPKDEKIFLRLVAACFAMRRKTLLNNLCAAFSLPRERAQNCLLAAGLDTRVRGEALTLMQLAALADAIYADQVS